MAEMETTRRTARRRLTAETYMPRAYNPALSRRTLRSNRRDEARPRTPKLGGDAGRYLGNKVDGVVVGGAFGSIPRRPGS
jgi:hypothetical protein